MTSEKVLELPSNSDSDTFRNVGYILNFGTASSALFEQE